MTTDTSRTLHASQAVAVSDMISLKFAKLELGGKTSRTLKVTEPDGPSTDGGRKARQSLILVPIQGKESAILCGFIDTARGVAELRSFIVLDNQNKDRYGKPLDIMRVDYDKFLHEMVTFLGAQGLDARVTNEKVERATSTLEASVVARSNVSFQMGMMFVLMFLLGLLAGYVIFEVM